MNKILKITGIVALLGAVVYWGATAVYAQGPHQPSNGPSQQMQQGPGTPGSGLNLQAVDEAEMHAAIAAALNMSVADFEAALAAGQTPATLAAERGIDYAVIQAAMDTLHQAALQQAVDDGLITQEQADWMLSRRGGNMPMGGGLQGSGTPANGSHQGGMGRHGTGGTGSYQDDCPNQNS